MVFRSIIKNELLSEIEKPTVKFIESEYSSNIVPKFNFKGNLNAPNMVNQLVADDARKNQIIEEIIALNKEGRKILVLSGRRGHCEVLNERIRERLKKVTTGLYLGGMKCHLINTPILMFDGSVKMVQNIQINDLLMGDDSTSRKVLSLSEGEGKMYKIIPNKGDYHIVNSEHILCLKWSSVGIAYSNNKWIARSFDNKDIKIKSKTFDNRTDAEIYLNKFSEQSKICEISVKKYLKLPKQLKNVLKLYRVPIEFTEKYIPFDPYIIGLWIGDGTSANTGLTSQDSAVIVYLKKKLPEYNLYLEYRNYKNGNCYAYNIADPKIQGVNYFMQILNKLNLVNNKHVPDIYKNNSRQIRLELLAGLLDSDGTLSDHNCYHFEQKNELVIDGIIYLARSLGFSAYKAGKKTSWTYKGVKKYGTAFTTTISGNINQIPCKIKRKQAAPRQQIKDILVSGFKIEELSDDKFYGFELDNNNRYVLGDFTVTHNSSDLETSNKASIIFATYSMASEAYDNPDLDTLIMATGMGSIQQAVGRIIRKKNKFHPLVVDFTDIEYFGGQARRRKQFYKKSGYRFHQDPKKVVEPGSESESESDSDVCLFDD